MPQTEFAPERRRERRWRALPPIPAGWESLSGLGVLEEVQGELGGLLWRSLRTVLLWAQVPARERAGLFPQGTEEARLADLLCLFPEPVLEAPLATLAEVLGSPADVDPRRVALACTRIAYWAQNRGARQTQWEFAHAAALACPSDPRAALALGRAHRDRGAYKISEAWYKRAVSLARQGEDPETYARGYIGLGKMWIARGSFPKARKSLLKALRAAEQDEELREIEGMAAHDLCALAIESDHEEMVAGYATTALAAYGPGHRSLPSMAHDIAFFWLKRGYFDAALPIFRSVALLVPQTYRPLVQGNIARAAGGLRDRDSYAEARKAVLAIEDTNLRKADALLGVAHGALGLGLWKEAEDAASQARIVASERGEAEILFSAEAVLQTARNERAVQENLCVSAPISTDVNRPHREDLVVGIIGSLAPCALAQA